MAQVVSVQSKRVDRDGGAACFNLEPPGFRGVPAKDEFPEAAALVAALAAALAAVLASAFVLLPLKTN